MSLCPHVTSETLISSRVHLLLSTVYTYPHPPKKLPTSILYGWHQVVLNTSVVQSQEFCKIRARFLFDKYFSLARFVPLPVNWAGTRQLYDTGIGPKWQTALCRRRLHAIDCSGERRGCGLPARYTLVPAAPVSEFSWDPISGRIS